MKFLKTKDNRLFYFPNGDTYTVIDTIEFSIVKTTFPIDMLDVGSKIDWIYDENVVSDTLIECDGKQIAKAIQYVITNILPAKGILWK